jgi:hypothetical protein
VSADAALSAELAVDRDVRGAEVLGQVPAAGSWVRLLGHEGVVEGGQPEAREVIGGGARGVEVEGDVHLLAQALERELAHAVTTRWTSPAPA